MNVSEPFSLPLAADLRELAKVTGLPYKAIMALRANGALSYPVTETEYLTLAGLLNGLGKTKLVRIIVSRRSVAERQMMLLGCDMGRIEREALLYIIRHRLEHEGRKPKVYLDYMSFTREFAKRFPNGFRRINADKLNKIKKKANTIIVQARENNALELLIEGLRMGRIETGKIVNRRRNDDRKLKNAERLAAAEQMIQEAAERKAREEFDYLSGFKQPPIHKK